MSWTCLFGCKVEWQKDTFEQNMIKVNYYHGAEVAKTPHAKTIQRGTCKLCGKIYDRIVR